MFVHKKSWEQCMMCCTPFVFNCDCVLFCTKHEEEGVTMRKVKVKWKRKDCHLCCGAGWMKFDPQSSQKRQDNHHGCSPCFLNGCRNCVQWRSKSVESIESNGEPASPCTRSMMLMMPLTALMLVTNASEQQRALTYTDIWMARITDNSITCAETIW